MAKRRATTSHTDNSENFNLDVSGSDSDEAAAQPVRQNKRAQKAAEPVDQAINDPTPPADSKKAADVHHFFERQEDKQVCKVCK
jgi:hypothetical protein